MSDCEWMFGDAATGLLGVNALAGLNPLRWSGSKSFDQAIKDIQDQCKHKDRAIVVKVPSGLMAAEQNFPTHFAAIEFLASKDPKKNMSTKNHLAMQLAQQEVATVEHELKAANLKAAEKAALEERQRQAREVAKQAAEESLKSAEASAADQEMCVKEAQAEVDKRKGELKAIQKEEVVSGIQSKWMYGDAAQHLVSSAPAIFHSAAILNPLRWSNEQSIDATVKELQALRANGVNRSIGIKAPPDAELDTQETIDAAIKRLYEICPKYKALKEKEDKQTEVIVDSEHRLATRQILLAEAQKKVKDAQNEIDGLRGALIFQLGTNNWQRPKKDGSGELEFAPGSGVLHEAHHNAYNHMPGIRCYSMYPSKNQGQPRDHNADYRVFELEHDIPICESASPNSSKRWHLFSEEEFAAYLKRMEDEVYDYLKQCEEREHKKFTMFIAHHSFLNPLVLRNVIQRRVKDGEPAAPLFCFVHGTALKMYRWELGGKDPKEFPMRFHKWIVGEKLFDDIDNGVNACFVISAEQKGGIAEIFPSFPQERVIVAPNGINLEKFKPREKTMQQVIVEQTCEQTIVWPAAPPADCSKYTQMVAFVGKAAEWKRQAALLYAAAEYEKEYPNLITLCVGVGPDEEMNKLKTLCEKLELKNTFLLGPRSQDVLAEIYTVANLGCFPSFKEPFGLVFVECMACRTPVIGCNSGGPKDFVDSSVGELVAEPPETSDLSTVAAGVVTLGKTLNEAISRSLKENWKERKADACIKLAHDKFSVEFQVSEMIKSARGLS